ncbi:MAG TPA: PQQ-dependent sugar dehydrogenase [Chloroflexia bacterium]
MRLRLQHAIFPSLFLALIAVAAILLWGAGGAVSAAPDDGTEQLPPGATTQTVLSDLDNPIAMAFDPQGRLFYTEKTTGKVRLFENGALQPDAVITFSVTSGGEQGLLGIAIDPDFNTNHYIYVYYTCACTPLENRVVRFVETNGVGSSPTTIFTSPNDTAASNHNGGNIHFGPDGKLYISLGDDGITPANSQNVAVKQGKIHRINSDGTIPTDNPVFTQTGALPSLYAMGLRNSFDFTFDPLTPGRIFASENGPGCDDELNRIEAGYNYGWRASYPCDDANPSPTYNTIAPLWYLASGACCEAPTGVTVYRGHQLPAWQNHLFMVTYNNGLLRHYYLNADRTLVSAVNVVEGVTAKMDIETGPDGALWYMENGGYAAGDLKRIVGPQGCASPFADVPAGNDFYAGTTCLACRNIVSGYACGGPTEPCDPANSAYFRPNGPITRGQIAKIVSESAGFNETPGGQVFEDVPTDNTFYAWIGRLAGRGIMGGYPCGGANEPCVAPANRPYFRPNGDATRGQLAKIVSNAKGYSDTPTGQRFEDVPPSNPFYVWIERLASRGAMSGYECGGAGEPCVAPGNRPYFRWGASVTRGQSVKIVANTFFPGCDISTDR